MNQKPLDLGAAQAVHLRQSDRGMELVFLFPNSRSVNVGLSWGHVADMCLRLDFFGEQANQMLAVGLDPCRADHRESFEFAALQVLCDEGDKE